MLKLEPERMEAFRSTVCNVGRELQTWVCLIFFRKGWKASLLKDLFWNQFCQQSLATRWNFILSDGQLNLFFEFSLRLENFLYEIFVQELIYFNLKFTMKQKFCAVLTFARTSLGFWFCGCWVIIDFFSPSKNN